MSNSKGDKFEALTKYYETIPCFTDAARASKNQIYEPNVWISVMADFMCHVAQATVSIRQMPV